MLMEKIFKFGYLYDLVWKKKYPIVGIRRQAHRKTVVRNGKIHKIRTPGPLSQIVLTEKDYKQFQSINWGQPFEVYWNYNAVRKNLEQRGVTNRFGMPYLYRPLPPHRATVKEYVALDGSSMGIENPGNGKMYYRLNARILDKFEVFKAAKEAKYKKRYMS